MTLCKKCYNEYNYNIQSVSCPHEVLEILCEQNNIKIISKEEVH